MLPAALQNSAGHNHSPSHFPLPRFRHSLIWYRCPNRLGGFLLFKAALKYTSELLHVKHADCRTRDACRDEREGTVVRQENCLLKKIIIIIIYTLHSLVPVRRCWKETQYDVPPLHADDVARGVQEVKVKMGISGDGAVEPCLQECSPLLLKDSRRPAEVCFAHTSHTGHHHLKWQSRSCSKL